MFDIITLAEGGDSLPLEGKLNPLLPETFDIFWSIVSVAVVGFLFWKYLLPMFYKTLDERTRRIEGGLEKAEAAQAEAKAALDKYNAQLAEARAEGTKIRDDARAQGQQILADMKTEAQAESDRIVAAGEQQLLVQRQQIISELRSDVGHNSLTLAEKLLGEELSDSVRRSDTIDRFLANLDTAAAAGHMTGK